MRNLTNRFTICVLILGFCGAVAMSVRPLRWRRILPATSWTETGPNRCP